MSPRPGLGNFIEGALVKVRWLPTPSIEKVISGELLRVGNIGPVPFVLLKAASGFVLIRASMISSVEIDALSEREMAA